MTAVITGDIVNSRMGEVNEWLSSLKKILNFYGKSPQQWEIFRGDSFQLALPPKEALYACLHIKAGIRNFKDLDVRLAIGVGEEEHHTGKITEANGSAFVRSGECFESLKKQNLAIKTADPQIDEVLNLLFSLALLTMDNWSPIIAATIQLGFENPQKNQKELSQMLQKSQSSISEVLKRGGFDEVMELNEFYQKQISRL